MGTATAARTILTYPGCDIECARRLESTFKRHIEAESVAAVIFEPVSAKVGLLHLPQSGLKSSQASAARTAFFVIADEIQTGFCRTGPLFACQHFGVEPDIIVTAKSIACRVAPRSRDGPRRNHGLAWSGGLGGTFGGNPDGMRGRAGDF